MAVASYQLCRPMLTAVAPTVDCFLPPDQYLDFCVSGFASNACRSSPIRAFSRIELRLEFKKPAKQAQSVHTSISEVACWIRSNLAVVVDGPGARHGGVEARARDQEVGTSDEGRRQAHVDVAARCGARRVAELQLQRRVRGLGAVVGDEVAEADHAARLRLVQPRDDAVHLHLRARAAVSGDLYAAAKSSLDAAVRHRDDAKTALLSAASRSVLHSTGD